MCSTWEESELLTWHDTALIPRTPPVLGGVVAEVEGRLHQRDVAECLRHVPYQSAVTRIILLAEQSDVTAQREQPLEQLDRLLPPAAQFQRRLASCGYYLV
jgi:hypothetical protein